MSSIALSSASGMSTRKSYMRTFPLATTAWSGRKPVCGQLMVTSLRILRLSTYRSILHSARRMALQLAKASGVAPK
eukprot:5569881-Prymnesium_polylepis.1